MVQESNRSWRRATEAGGGEQQKLEESCRFDSLILAVLTHTHFSIRTIHDQNIGFHLPTLAFSFLFLSARLYHFEPSFLFGQ